ncbi:MAG: 3-dehydroquinate synthase [Lachnospiraceae bacterium]|nr:3-dehydroquinate synthase [Lachnospiraceae bacterium]
MVKFVKDDRLTIKKGGEPIYDIVYSDSFETLGTEIGNLGRSYARMCIVTDSDVGPLYGDKVKEVLEKMCDTVCICLIPAGEEHKNLDTVKAIYKHLIENGFDRKDLLIALGGGVVGDITGYTAATYLRGVDFIQVPTTLLAQCDSSIGGKTGVDFDGYKNMVGAFYMPRLVYMNLSVLKTLSDRQFYSGFAEVMKHGLIKDDKFYTWLIDNMYEISDREYETLKVMVYNNCLIKGKVVDNDPTEQGERALLNFGHTIGHAIEKSRDFQMLHGECVALGAVAAAYISWQHKLISMEEFYEIRDMFVPFNLPISIEDIDPEEILELTKSDKKMKAGHIRFILLNRIGSAIIDETVTDEDIIGAVKHIIWNEDD